MSFGASTHVYILREKPQTQGSAEPGELKAGEDEELKHLLGLPEEETELNNLTEINTTHNKRISTLTIEESELTTQRSKRRRRRRSSRVSFSDEDEVINPEVVDPSVGPFRNMIETTAVPEKEGETLQHTLGQDAASNLEELALVLPNLAPGVDVASTSPQPPITLNSTSATGLCTAEPLNEPCKKKYDKEAWPGKKPTPSLLI